MKRSRRGHEEVAKRSRRSREEIAKRSRRGRIEVAKMSRKGREEVEGHTEGVLISKNLIPLTTLLLGKLLFCLYRI